MLKKKLNKITGKINILSVTGNKIGSIGNLPELVIGETYIFSIDYSYNIAGGQSVITDFQILINTTDNYLSVYSSIQTKTLSGSGTGTADFTVTIPSGIQYENKQILATANILRHSDSVLFDTYEENPIAIIVPPPAPITITNYTVSYYPDYLGFNNYITVIQEFDYSTTEDVMLHLVNRLFNDAGDIITDELIDIPAGSGHKRYVSFVLNDGSLGYSDFYHDITVKAAVSSSIIYGDEILAEKIYGSNVVLSPIGIYNVQPDTSGTYPPDDGDDLIMTAVIKNNDTIYAKSINVKFELYERDTGNHIFSSGWSSTHTLGAAKQKTVTSTYTVDKNDFSTTGLISIDVEIWIRSYSDNHIYNRYYCNECAHISLSGIDVSITDITIS